MNDVQNLLLFILAELVGGLRPFRIWTPIFTRTILSPTLQGALSQSKLFTGEPLSCSGFDRFLNQ
ncbi:Uncharacterised protein [Mycobacterium tuberculosis]|nr:Uncharacterised protein [Mycobacterium tuberculosis]